MSEEQTPKTATDKVADIAGLVLMILVAAFVLALVGIVAWSLLVRTAEKIAP